jgi:hypothetical protein
MSREDAREFRTLHVVRVSRIKKLSPISTWKPPGRNSQIKYIIEIDFENGDYVKVFADSITETQAFSEQQLLIYQLETITTISEPETKSRTKFVFYQAIIPLEVTSMLEWVKQSHIHIVRSAEIAANTFSEVYPYSETEFKDRAQTVFDWMRSTMMSLDFNTLDGKAFDQWFKERQ